MKKFNINFKGAACREAQRYYAKYKTSRGAWNNCLRGDWMLWIAQRLGIDDRLLTLAKGRCAETVFHLMEEEISKFAVQQAIRYGKGEISREELDAAAYDAADAASAAAYAAFAAAYDAAYAASAASAFAASATAADAAAFASAFAAEAAAAKKRNQKQTADICRELLTEAVFEKIEKLTN
jgi:hypothetical protein